MPSWNIHTAHVERLLREEGAEALGIRDVNTFLVGNFVPDTYVGYMVPDASHRIDYKLTHFAQREHIPLPGYDQFWEFYMRDKGVVSDLVLGAWCHLVADHIYNAHTRRYLERIGVQPGEQARIGKQSDFALFGRTLRISLRPQVTDGLIRAGEEFPQYSIEEPDMRATVAAACRIVDANCANQVDDPDYQLLSAEFFETARAEADEVMREGLLAYASATA